MPMQWESETQQLPPFHPSGEINMINRYPELGPAMEGFPGNVTRCVEIETQGHTFLTADECDALALRLGRHAAILRLP
jgi:hypothetical protein